MRPKVRALKSQRPEVESILNSTLFPMEKLEEVEKPANTVTGDRPFSPARNYLGFGLHRKWPVLSVIPANLIYLFRLRSLCSFLTQVQL
jgi:hypothetical protein